MFTYQAADAFALIANHEGKGARQIRLVILCLGFTRQSNHPDILFFEEINSAREVRFLGDQQMFAGPCRGFDDGSVHLSRTMLGQNDTMHSYCLGAAEQRAKVVDILDSVEDKQKRSLFFAFSIGKNLLQAGIASFFDKRYTALVNCSVTELVETEAWYHFNGNVSLFSLVQDGSEGWRFTLTFSQQYTFDAPLRVQRF